MALDFQYAGLDLTSGILVLPYLAVQGEGYTNRGFFDLRGRPDAARQVPEAASSAALQSLLAQLATPGSPFFSIGCDLNGHQVGTALFPHALAIGGYVQVVRTDFSGSAPLMMDEPDALASELRLHLERLAGPRAWKVQVLTAMINASTIGGPSRAWSSVIEMVAIGENPGAAKQSAEALIGAVGACLSRRDQAQGSAHPPVIPKPATPFNAPLTAF